MKKNNYKILLSKVAIEDRKKLYECGLIDKCNNLLEKMSENPFCYPPSYEKLVGDLKGYYSRRINRQHRINYIILDNKKEIHIIRMWTHYE